MTLAYKKNIQMCLIISAFLLQFHCGFYSFSGSVAPHLKTVAIPLFENRTVEFGIAEELTDAVIDEFSRDNTLKISDRALADMLIDGAIVRVDDRAGAFDQSERVQDMKLYLTVSVTCTDQVKREKLWEERITQWGSYDPSEGADARRNGISEAIEKISQEILNKSVSGW
ncbi:hypothetical protein A2V82_10355 [candidate division KSB1 bacterium RBG_16_48_16]|nr:MAG: hypothetical protein A2V82_10355 [candidate division KSB1 bacterium RBG_16_48_16]